MTDTHPLLVTLALAVPLEIIRLRQMDDGLRDLRIARHTGLAVAEILGERGDQLLYGGKQCAATFKAVAQGLACLAFTPGGVTVFGMHFCAAHQECLDAEKQSAEVVEP